MKKIIIIIIMSIFANTAYSIDLRKLSKTKREKKIREICKATILKYGDSRYWVEGNHPTNYPLHPTNPLLSNF